MSSGGSNEAGASIFETVLSYELTSVNTSSAVRPPHRPPCRFSSRLVARLDCFYDRNLCASFTGVAALTVGFPFDTGQSPPPTNLNRTLTARNSQGSSLEPQHCLKI